MIKANPAICGSCKFYRNLICTMTDDLNIVQTIFPMKVRQGGIEYDIVGKPIPCPTGVSIPNDCPYVTEQAITQQDMQ